MNETVIAFATADDEVRALLASLPFPTAIVTEGEPIEGARAALLRPDDEAGLRRCREATIPALVFGGEAAGGHAVRSRADVCAWVRALAAGTTPADPGPLPPPVDEQRAALAAEPPRAAHPLRIVHIGTYAFGETDVVHRIVDALRTLGHEVVAVDPRAIEGLATIERLDGVVPITVDVERLSPLLDRFGPDLIIWDAGGFHPTAEAARALHDRGIPQLHLVLSDPDAHETARTFAARFDAVATNARDRVSAYEQLGVPLVRHLPFAVDHAFTVAPVPATPEWRADVVCVGHGRPDRQETMKQLAQRFDVRVYGRNWELPAVEAAGQDVFAALREGTFHVNFPLTKAGFTNVKVGVFESVAQGGILCTRVFDEMASLFAYDREIVGYLDDEQLAAAIDWLRTHPDEAEEIRRRGFARLAREHLWEHRFEQLLGAMAITPRSAPAGRVVVVGEQLEDAIAAVDRARAGSVISAVTSSPARALLDLGVDAFPLDAVFDAEDAIRRADAVVFAGPIDDTGFILGGGIPDVLDGASDGLAALARALLLAAVHEVPVFWHQVHVAGSPSPDARALIGFLGRLASSVSAGEEESAAHLRSCGIEAAIGGELALPPAAERPGRVQAYPRRSSARDHVIADLRRQVSARSRQIRDLRAQVKELRAELAQRKRQARAARRDPQRTLSRIRRSIARRLDR